jgi:hypothetical protein
MSFTKFFLKHKKTQVPTNAKFKTIMFIQGCIVPPK